MYNQARFFIKLRGFVSHNTFCISRSNRTWCSRSWKLKLVSKEDHNLQKVSINFALILYNQCHFNLPDRSLIERQKQRLDCLVKALSQEKGHLAQLKRETQILAAPLPPPSATQKLREYVERLRDQCDTMAKRLEMAGNSELHFFFTCLLTWPVSYDIS